MTLHQTNDTPLRRVLLANALVSAISGLALVLAPEASATLLFAETFTLFGIASETLLSGLGLGLLIFAGFVAFTARQKRLRLGQAKLIVLADLLWVIDSAVLLVAFPDRLPPLGFELVLIVGAIVLVLAIGQIIGLALVYQSESEVEITRKGGHMTVTAAIGTTAPVVRARQVMSDRAGYAEVADYPYPIAGLTGEWSLVPAPSGSEIRMVFEIEAKPGLLNRLLLMAMSFSFAKVCDRLLRGWVRIMEREDEPIPALAGPGDDRVRAVAGG